MSSAHAVTTSPDLPRTAKKLPPTFVQTLGVDGVGTLVWCHLAGQTGVYQLLFVEVHEKLRRRGHGTALLDAAVGQIARHGRLVGVVPRRLIVLVNQPDVIARAWLSQRGGFVHVHTLEDVEADDDIMVMQRTFD